MIFREHHKTIFFSFSKIFFTFSEGQSNQDTENLMAKTTFYFLAFGKIESWIDTYQIGKSKINFWKNQTFSVYLSAVNLLKIPTKGAQLPNYKTKK